MGFLRLIFSICLIGVVSSYSLETRAPSTVKKQIRVFVIDTGIYPHKDLVKYLRTAQNPEDAIDNHGHGTHVAGTIVYGSRHVQSVSDPLCEEVEIISCKYYDPKKPGLDNLKETIKCLKKAVELKPDYLNYSGGGTEFSQEEMDLYKTLAAQGTISVVAAGNERSDLRYATYFPASYSLRNGVKNIIPVASTDALGRVLSSSNYYPGVIKFDGQNIFSTLPNDMYGYMTGTSQAAPGALHTILKHRCEQLRSKSSSQRNFKVK